jgi:Ca2+-binding RTX toxin-like protein
MGGFAATPLGGQLNVAVSNFAKAYRNNAMIGDMLAPRVPVDRQSFQYLIHGRDGLRLDGSTLRAPGNAPRTIRSSFSLDTYFTKSHALAAEIPFETEQLAQGYGFSEIQKAAQQVMDKLLLDREVTLAGLVAGAGTTVALSGTSMWDNAASTPIQDVTKARATVRQSGTEASVLILGDPVADALLTNAQIVARFVNSVPGVAIDMDGLSRVLGIKCVRASAIQVDKGDAVSFVWGQTATLAVVNAVSSQQDLSSVKTFTWTAAPDTVDGYGVITEPKYPLSAKATLVSSDWYWDMKITAPETLYTFSNACAAPTYVSNPAFPSGE